MPRCNFGRTRTNHCFGVPRPRKESMGFSSDTDEPLTWLKLSILYAKRLINPKVYAAGTFAVWREFLKREKRPYFLHSLSH